MIGVVAGFVFRSISNIKAHTKSQDVASQMLTLSRWRDFATTPKTMIFPHLELIGYDHAPPVVVGSREMTALLGLSGNPLADAVNGFSPLR